MKALNKIWQGKWIGDPRYQEMTKINVFHKEMEISQLPPHHDDLKNQHMLVRKTFTVREDFDQAYLDITGDDYYKVYLNGNFLGQGPAPSYHFDYNYNRYDITKFLKLGENIIAVHVYYQGLINRVWNSGDYRQGMIAELFVGHQLVVKSDQSWKYQVCEAYQSDKTIGYDTQYLENIDARKWDSHWRELGYNDSSWHNIQANSNHDYQFKIQQTPSVTVYNMKPKAIREMGTGHYLIDFGQEITGQFTMKAHGNLGDKVEIRCGEELESDNNQVKYDMRCNCLYQEFWTLSGLNDCLEHYDYKAFRYVEIIAPPKTVDPESFSAIVRHYPFNENQVAFTSSHQLLNNIWDICKDSVKYGTQEAYLDCPTREKGQYLGDITITGHSHLLLTGDLNLYKKALQDFANSSFISPSLMAVAPGSFMQEIADYSFQWPMQLLLYYHHSGDLKFIEEMYPVVEGLVEYFRAYQGANGLLENVTEKWNLVDWPANLRDDYDFPLEIPIKPGYHNVINAFYYGMLLAVQEIQSLLDIETDLNLERIQESFRETFYCHETKLFVDSENSHHSSLHANVLPLFYGLAPQEAVSEIVELIRQKGFNCGVYMAYFVLKALAKVGEHQLIFDLLVNESEQSWANMIKEGATTCFEAWGKDQKWNTSLCHPWASAPISVLIEGILGITPQEPGWQKISCQPRLPQEIDDLELKFPVKTGLIHLKVKDGKIDIQAPVPVND